MRWRLGIGRGFFGGRFGGRGGWRGGGLAILRMGLGGRLVGVADWCAVAVDVVAAAVLSGAGPVGVTSSADLSF